MTERTVSELMNRDVVTVGRNDSLTVAEQTMVAGEFRHLPVLNEDGELAGIVSHRDIYHSAFVKALGHGVAAKNKMFDMLLVKEVMSEHIISTTADAPLSEAATTMLEHKVGCLPVLDQGKLVGILTESSFVRQFA